MLKDNILIRNTLLPTDAAFLGRSQLLDDQDRMLVEAILLRKQSAEAVSRLTGIKAYWIRFRVRQLVRLMTSAPFVRAMRAMPRLTPQDALVAKLRYCQGMSRRELCGRTGLSLYHLRRQLDRIDGLIARSRQGRESRTALADAQKNLALRLYPQGAFRCPTVKTGRRSKLLLCGHTA